MFSTELVVEYLPTRLVVDWFQQAQLDQPGGWVGGCVSEWTKTKLMLISTQVEVVVKVEVELANYSLNIWQSYATMITTLIKQ